MEFRFESWTEIVAGFSKLPSDRPVEFIHSSLGITQYITETFLNSMEVDYFGEKIRLIKVMLKQDGQHKILKLNHNSFFIIKFK